MSTGARRAITVALTTALTLGVTGCSSVGDLVGGGEEDTPQVAEIAVLVPDAAEGDPASAGVLASVRHATQQWPDIDGWEIEVVPVADGTRGGDDASPVDERVRDAAEDAASDRTVAAIGGLSDEVVRFAAPILDDNGIIFVSPADDLPANTHGADPNQPMRPYRTYFRTTVQADPDQLISAYLATELQAERVAIVDGGDGGEDDAPARHESLMQVLSGAGVEADVYPARNRTERAEVVAQLAGSGVSAVWAAGERGLAPALAAELHAAGVSVPVLDGPEIQHDAVIEAAGAGVDLLVSLELPSENTAASAANAEAAELLAGPDLPPPGPYGAAAYDAARAVGDALQRCLPPAGDAEAARTGCLAEMGQVNVAGLGGQVAFDSFGDRLASPVVTATVEDGVWTEQARSH